MEVKLWKGLSPKNVIRSLDGLRMSFLLEEKRRNLSVGCMLRVVEADWLSDGIVSIRMVFNWN